MATFFATLCYELDPATAPDARKLLRAELVGRRWRDRHRERSMPAGALWIQREAGAEETTDDVHRACAADLGRAVAAVVATGRPVAVRRAWVQVAGAGTFGLVELDGGGSPA